MKNWTIKIDKSEADAVYIQIKKQLKEYILKQELPGGTRLPTVTEIAELAGVSLRTAEKALNELVKEHICYRRPKCGTFVSEDKGIVKQLKICAVYHPKEQMVIPTIIHESAILYGLRSQANKNSMNIFFLSNKNPVHDINFLLRNDYMNFTGIALFQAFNEQISEMARSFPKLKFIILNYYTQNFELTPPNVYGVFNDDFAGSYQMTQYLISQNYTNICFIILNIDDDTYNERLQGYRCAMKNNGLKCKKNSIVSLSQKKGLTHRALGYIGARKLFSQKQKIDAICTVHDEIAAGIQQYVNENFPEKKVIVAGYDNMQPEISKENQFNTIQVNFSKIGRTAIDILSKPYASFPKINKITPQLIIRDIKVQYESTDRQRKPQLEK